MNSPRRATCTEAGFTLVELLAVISILGVISFALTEAVILGFKTTDGTIANISRSAAIQLLEPSFTADARSAERVWTSPAPACGTLPAFLQMSWTQGTDTKTVSYALDPPTGGDQELVRTACDGSGGALDPRNLGHFTHDPAGPLPLLPLCDAAPCSTDPGAVAPATITLAIQTGPLGSPPAPINLTVRRRRT